MNDAYLLLEDGTRLDGDAVGAAPVAVEARSVLEQDVARRVHATTSSERVR